MSGDVPAGRTWIVLLEAADVVGGSTIGPGDFRRLVASWATPTARTLYGPNRYALQLSVRAVDPVAALSCAMRLWKDALRRCLLPEWDLVRAEIVTEAQLERETQAAERAAERAGEVQGPAPVRRRPADPVGDELLRRALFDPVTGLPEGAIFMDMVRDAVATGGASVLGLLLVSLDMLGPDGRSPRYAAPDDVLVEVAGRLAGGVRRGETVARIGPDSFAVSFEVPSGTPVDCVARRVVDDLRKPLRDWGGAPPTASVGVAVSSDGCGADGLLRMAEVAMIEARDAGGDCHRHFAGARLSDETAS